MMNTPEQSPHLHTQNANALFERAFDAHQSGQPEEALLLYQQVIKLEPNHVDARALAGIINCQQGNNDEGIHLLEEAIAAEPNHLDALYNLGYALETAGRLDDAAKAYRRIIQLKPDEPDTYMQLASVFDKQGKSVEAEENICNALLAEPDNNKLFYTLIQRQVKSRHLDGALDTCEKFFNAYSCNMRALAFKAFVLNERGENDAARHLLDFEGLIQCDLPQEAPGYDTIEQLNADLVEFTLSHSTLAYEPAQKSTQAGSQTANIQNDNAKPITALRRLIKQGVDRYCQDHANQIPHPYLDSMPLQFSFDIWATVLNPEGLQKPHFHPGGWLSGVYYPALPSAMQNTDNKLAGHIEFGRPQDQFGFKAKPLTHPVQPQEGLMVLFPSYFYHRTIPFDINAGPNNNQTRISFAFDAVPQS